MYDAHFRNEGRTQYIQGRMYTKLRQVSVDFKIKLLSGKFCFDPKNKNAIIYKCPSFSVTKTVQVRSG
jgi:hypothetical protein